MDDHPVLPPPDSRSTHRIAGVGLAICVLSALLGLIPTSGPSLLSTVQLLLVAVGTLTLGSAVARRADLWPIWLAAAIGGFLVAFLGIPEHWDSARLLAKVLAGIALVGTIVRLLPIGVSMTLGGVLALFHFGGIFNAVLMPEPSPWLAQQTFSRIYRPYLTFAYLRNAYQFYAPEPGPASLMMVLVTYELDEPDPETGEKTESAWLKIPARDRHMKDPLGLAYYRRLSLTEMTVYTQTPGDPATAVEQQEAAKLRKRAAIGSEGTDRIPLAPPTIMADYAQYQVPRQDVARYLFPSYVRHIADEYSAPGRKVIRVKMYRVVHRIVSTELFTQGADPYDPVGYLPFFMGDYDADGKLLDPEDPMLYWLVPILPKPVPPGESDGPNYVDYLSKHAGYEVNWSKP